MRFKAIMIVFTLFLTISGALALNYMAAPSLCKKGSPEAVATKFLKANAKNDYDAMRKLATPEMIAMINLAESFNEMSDSPDTETPASKVVKCEELNGQNKAICEVCCNDEGNNNKLTLLKVDGNWLVHMEKE